MTVIESQIEVIAASFETKHDLQIEGLDFVPQVHVENGLDCGRYSRESV